MEKPSISIIVPVYNVAPYVEDCIKSVKRQTYDGPMECIVVDDCGTDNSMEIVERLVAEYTGPISFKIFQHTHNRGLSAARNTGMDAASGDYLFFLDSDDEITDDCILKMVAPLEQESYDVVLGDVKYIKVLPSNHIQDAHGPQELNISESLILRPPMILRRFRKDWKGVAWNKLFHTSFLRQYHLHFKEGLLYEDNLWSFQIACLASSLYILNQITYIHKKRGGSIMDLSTENELINYLKIIVPEMGMFVDKYQIDNADLFPQFNSFFCKILDFHSRTYTEYASIYKVIRPYIKVPVRYVFISNRYCIKKNLHDLHYLLPMSIAPLWQYIIFNRLHPLIHKRMI